MAETEELEQAIGESVWNTYARMAHALLGEGDEEDTTSSSETQDAIRQSNQRAADKAAKRDAAKAERERREDIDARETQQQQRGRGGRRGR